MMKKARNIQSSKIKYQLIENADQLIEENDTHEDSEFVSVHFNQLNIADHTFENCKFSSCHFQNMAMPGATFRSCVFEKCEFVLSKMSDVTLSDTIFESCKIMGVNFSECNNFAFSAEYHNCSIDNSMFFSMDFRKGKFLKCRLVDTDLSDCDFSEADFSDTIFKHVTIHNCNFEKADFRSAQGYAINAATNQVHNARFSLPEAQSFLSFLGIKLEN
jgi:fluoroquinolone resistance protein